MHSKSNSFLINGIVCALKCCVSNPIFGQQFIPPLSLASEFDGEKFECDSLIEYGDNYEHSLKEDL